MRRAAALAAAGALLAAGCSSTFVESRKKVKGPVSEVGLIDAGGGHIKYSTSGWESVVRGRRRDAFSRMAGYCGGADRYKIVDEVTRYEDEAAFQAEDLEESVGSKGRHYGTHPYQHLFFECLK